MGSASAFLKTSMSAPAASVNSTSARVNSASVLIVSPSVLTESRSCAHGADEQTKKDKNNRAADPGTLDTPRDRTVYENEKRQYGYILIHNLSPVFYEQLPAINDYIPESRSS